MDPELVAQSLNFHGQQLTKTVENEKGPNFLQGVSQRDLDYQVFQKRSKELGFQDRGKRNRLHQFIAENASVLFKAEKKSRESHNPKHGEDLLPILPPLESFCNFDKDEARANFFQSIKHGDVLIVQIQQKQFHGLTFRLIATDDCTRTRDVRELGIKGSIHPDHSVAIADRKDGSYNVGDLVRCEVIDVSPESEKLVCGLKGVNQPAERMDLKFGLISKDQLPKTYRAMMEHDGKSYDECLQSTRTFYNPSATEHLAQSFGLDLTSASCSMLKALSTPIDDKDMADALRKTQSHKWSRHSTTEGIKYFRSGMETEAFQCFNKALHIDPVNVEALVARGALYANKGSYEKAIADFEVALKENPTHANAVNYASETLVAYAKQLEEEKNVDGAIQQYQKCLSINPNHSEARASLQQLSKGRGRPSFNLDFLDLENGKKEHDTDEKEEGRKSRRHKKKKRGGSSSSSRSSSSSSSRFSSPDSGSSRGRKKSRKSKKDKREQSLSPFSKKMAQLNPPMAGSAPEVVPAPSLYPSTEYPSVSTQPHPVPPPSFGALSSGNPSAPAFAGYSAPVPAPDPFLSRPAANEEYEKKVEMFLQRVGKGGDEEKEREKDKKKKKKKEKSKDKKKKDGKREKGKDKKHKKKKKGSDDEDSDNILTSNPAGLDELGELEAKLNAVYSKLTAKKKKKKRKRHSSGSSESSSSSGSSSDSELERKKRKAKKALEDLAAAAGLLRATENKAKPEPVPPPAYVPTPGAGAADEGGKWRSMPLKVNLGRASDEPEVEESRMVYMKEEHKGMHQQQQQQQQHAMEQDDDLPPGEDKVSFQFKPFGVFGPGGRQLAKPVSPPKGMDEQPQEEGNHEKGGRSRSGSRRRSRSRSRSRSRRSRSRSRSRSRGRSYSRSRSRSRSGERRHHTHRYRGGNRHPNQNYHHRGGRYPQRGGYNNRGRGWINYNNRGGYNNRPYHNRPYNNNNNQGYDNRRHRGRNRGGYWQQQMRSYSRSRSRTRSRSHSRSRSYSRSGSRSPSRSRSRSRHDNRRDRDVTPRDERRHADQKPEEKVAPVPAPTGVPPPSLGRKMGGKWDDGGGGGGDDDEDLVPPGCE